MWRGKCNGVLANGKGESRGYGACDSLQLPHIVLLSCYGVKQGKKASKQTQKENNLTCVRV